MTSHDVVNRLRRILHIKRIGHSGTLDPDATGVLLVLIGKACKVLPFLPDTDKEYIATMALGQRTLSDDIWGEVLETKEVTPITNFQALCDRFIGTQQQLPPLLRVQGRHTGEIIEIQHETLFPSLCQRNNTPFKEQRPCPGCCMGRCTKGENFAESSRYGNS